MPRIDFSNVQDAKNYSPLPEGTYPCQVSDVEEAFTRNADEMFKLVFEVTDGEFAGRRIFDNLVFSDAALKRAKMILSRLGVDVSGEVDLTPDMLVKKQCLVSVAIEEYLDRDGNGRTRNNVPYGGYAAVDDASN